MGYYTNYYLEVKVNSLEKMKEIVKKFNEIYQFNELDINNIDEGGITAEFESKWYSHDEDMLQLSRLFPDYVFELEGKGEERDDWWISCYKNGRMATSNAELIPPQSPDIID